MSVNDELLVLNWNGTFLIRFQIMSNGRHWPKGEHSLNGQFVYTSFNLRTKTDFPLLFRVARKYQKTKAGNPSGFTGYTSFGYNINLCKYLLNVHKLS